VRSVRPSCVFLDSDCTLQSFFLFTNAFSICQEFIPTVTFIRLNKTIGEAITS
jgi:hypothetical protein